MINLESLVAYLDRRAAEAKAAGPAWLPAPKKKKAA
jgi:hypothetical protein